MSLSQTKKKSVIVIGEGNAAKRTISYLASRYAGFNVTIVAGVPDPDTFSSIVGVTTIKLRLSDNKSLGAALKERAYARLFLVLPDHADRSQIGRSCLEVARDAGINQVAIISALTAETHTESDGKFRSPEDNAETPAATSWPQEEGGVVGAPSSPFVMPSPSPSVSQMDTDDARSTSSNDDSYDSHSQSPHRTVSVGTAKKATVPSKCLRVQRRTIRGWFPMKVKIVQFSLFNVDPKSRGAKPAKLSDNGLEDLQRDLLGPHRQQEASSFAALQSTGGENTVQPIIPTLDKNSLPTLHSNAAVNITPHPVGPYINTDYFETKSTNWQEYLDALAAQDPDNKEDTKGKAASVPKEIFVPTAATAPPSRSSSPLTLETFTESHPQAHSYSTLYEDFLASIQARRRVLSSHPGWM